MEGLGTWLSNRTSMHLQEPSNPESSVWPGLALETHFGIDFSYIEGGRGSNNRPAGCSPCAQVAFLFLPQFP